MITSIHIQNFRGFKNFEVKYLKRVNLIGGRNNSGKTSLIETIFFHGKLDQDTLLTFSDMKFYDNSLSNEQKVSQLVGMFFNLTSTSRHNSTFIEFVLDENDNSLSNNKQKNSYFLEYTSDLEIIKQSKVEKKSMNGNNGKNVPVTNLTFTEKIIVKINDTENEVGAFQLPSDYFPDLPNLNIIFGKSVEYIYSTFTLSDDSLLARIEQLKINSKKDFLIEVLQKIDSRIIDIETIGKGENPGVYLKTEQSGFIPINLFGDATRKILQIVISMIESQNSILLIDEIENGLHYSTHRQFWENLFKLSAELNIQIFAVSHSREMIEAFTDTALLEQNKDTASYIEMYYSKRDDDFFCNYLTPELLKLSLEKDHEFRG